VSLPASVAATSASIVSPSAKEVIAI
jgi:hypothetical protein